jgi:tetratricopeptide (TPR) repeat protein
MKKPLWQIKWHFWFVIVVVAAAAVGIATQIVAQSVKSPPAMQILVNTGQILYALTLLVVIFGVLVLLYELVQKSNASDEKLEILTQLLNRNRNLLAQVSHGVQLSEAAKAIVFRDMDRQSLREAVLEKLHQQDFDDTYAIIDNIAQRRGYEELAKQLRAEADIYRNATEEERLNQVIAHINRLCELYQWGKAAEQIERLLKSYGDSPRVQELPQMLADKKENHKRELLAEWDDAVKRQATDQSLEILRELDAYLTPNEGLALQESARDVFRTKLHNMGVQFSLAVTGKRWAQAVETGEQIIRDFPNSRMAQEIRDKMDVLKSKIQSPQ